MCIDWYSEFKNRGYLDKKAVERWEEAARKWEEARDAGTLFTSQPIVGKAEGETPSLS
jgi:large subunit ribosomal protein L15